MAQLKTFVCDVCGTQRKEANHWYMLDSTSKTLVIAKFDDSMAEQMEFHLCGAGCLQVKLSAKLAEWGAEALEAVPLRPLPPALGYELERDVL